ncbi:MAG: hypothetical protein ABR600_01365 [Actinomycetota bacterium]
MAGIRRLSAVSLIVLASCSTSPGSTGAGPIGSSAAAGPAAHLPRHFGIGVSAAPDANGLYGWMPKTKIPFDYAYQYLAAGVNTGQGWQTWNSNARFPLLYARGAARHGYIPVFPYYMLLQSDGPCGSCDEAQKDLAHLNDPGVMAAYYRDFAKLMQRLGPRTHDGLKGFGRTAIVHVEPDLSGYAEHAALEPSQCYGFCTGHGNNPSVVTASVKSSGVKEVAGFPDTYRGFNLALLHLRDVYAPNVLMAFHVSDWAALFDVGSSTDELNAAALGREAGAFAAKSGVNGSGSTYDLVFNDVADRDAGYYKYVYGNDAFWDRTNRTVPNFHRWEEFVGAVHARVHRPVIVWQIPLGNQYFRTENDADGHYQDNRAEYFFHHVSELLHAGVIALLFGAGNGGSTTNTDTKGDGVTNPSPKCTTDGGPRICPSHRSAVSDDDGGYLRMAARAYYRSPVSLL